MRIRCCRVCGDRRGLPRTVSLTHNLTYAVYRHKSHQQWDPCHCPVHVLSSQVTVRLALITWSRTKLPMIWLKRTSRNLALRQSYICCTTCLRLYGRGSKSPLTYCMFYNVPMIYERGKLNPVSPLGSSVGARGWWDRLRRTGEHTLYGSSNNKRTRGKDGSVHGSS
ncbi:hypothetical protein BDV36DRAFT_244992 [Aspergillus pseudocaelatus]|uniref:Uncharacterized protein n=1 Tax=Aspergillus pseudocaelatus TaxID=1825620 RepID=A0ABQ6X033_9EURO|nr:hypothetical protein BDV36DRAFT_244992 [Aspergillus pseudocaelatus]